MASRVRNTTVSRVGGCRVRRQRGSGIVQAHGEPTREQHTGRSSAKLASSRALLGRSGTGQARVQRKAKKAKRRPKARHFERFMG